MDMLPVVSAIREMRSPFEEELAPVPFWLFVRRHWAAVAAAAAAVVLALVLYFHYLPQLDWRSASPPTADINHVLQNVVARGGAIPPTPIRLTSGRPGGLPGRTFEQALVGLLLRQGSREPAVVYFAARCHPPSANLTACPAGRPPAGPGDPSTRTNCGCRRGVPACGGRRRPR
jgi:hypothetical protein